MSTYADRTREYAEVVRNVAWAVHEGGERTGYQKAIDEVRASTLAEVAAAIRAEARRGEHGAPRGQHLTYTGGLRRAAVIVDRLAREASDG